MSRLPKAIALAASLAASGCAQDIQYGYLWNPTHTGAQYADDPAPPADDPHPMKCITAPMKAGFPDNSWNSNQITVNAFNKICVDDHDHMATALMPNNPVATPSVATALLPAVIAAGGDIGAGALIAGATRSAAQIGAAAVSKAGPSIIQEQTTTVSATAASINSLSSTAGAVAGAVAH